MSLSYDMLDTFAEHETVVFTVAIRDREGAPIANPASAAVSMVVTSDAARDVKVFEMTDSPEIVHTGGGVFQFKPTDVNAALMAPGVIYYYDIWSVDLTNGRLHQVDGKIRLKQAARET
jgi:hypothetical protein